RCRSPAPSSWATPPVAPRRTSFNATGSTTSKPRKSAVSRGSGNSYATIIAQYAGTDAHAITSLLVGNDLLGDVEALSGRISHIDVAGDIGDESAGIRPTIAAYQSIGVEAASIRAD